MNPFADRGRGPRLAVAIAALAAMGAYYAWFSTTQVKGWRWCNEDPAARDGWALVFPLWTVTQVVGPDRFEISKAIPDVPVLGDARGLREGDTISLAGRFSAKDGAVVEEARELHPLRPWKEGLGVLGFVVAACAAPFAFRVRGGRVEERPWRT